MKADDVSSDSSVSSRDNSPSVSGEEAITLALASLDYLSSRDISTSVSGKETITLALASLDYPAKIYVKDTIGLSDLYL